MKTIRKFWLATGLTMTLIVTGCSDSSSSSGDNLVVTDSTEVPVSAGASPEAFVSYIQTLNATDDSAEPLTLSETFSVPADETNDPQPLT